MTFASDSNASDRWFYDLETWTHRIINDNRYKYNANPEKPTYDRVRIAILDAGFAYKKSIRPEAMSGYLSNFNDRNLATFGKVGPSNEDEDGHGTNVALLTARTCPNAEIYVARIAKRATTDPKGREPTEVNTFAVEEAIRWAI